MFNVGDIVQCIDAEVTNDRKELIGLGHLYVIVEVEPQNIRGHVCIARLSTLSNVVFIWSAGRFKVVEG